MGRVAGHGHLTLIPGWKWMTAHHGPFFDLCCLAVECLVLVMLVANQSNTPHDLEQTGVEV